MNAVVLFSAAVTFLALNNVIHGQPSVPGITVPVTKPGVSLPGKVSGAPGGLPLVGELRKNLCAAFQSAGASNVTGAAGGPGVKVPGGSHNASLPGGIGGAPGVGKGLPVGDLGGIIEALLQTVTSLLCALVSILNSLAG